MDRVYPKRRGLQQKPHSAERLIEDSKQPATREKSPPTTPPEYSVEDSNQPATQEKIPPPEHLREDSKQHASQEGKTPTEYSTEDSKQPLGAERLIEDSKQPATKENSHTTTPPEYSVEDSKQPASQHPQKSQWEHLICPNCKALPWDPVVGRDGQIYERECTQEDNNEASKGEKVSPALWVRQTIEALAEADVDNTDPLLSQWKETKQKKEEQKLYPLTRKCPMQGLVCPLSFQLPWNPVVTEDGIVYERETIEEHLDCFGFLGGVSPITRAKMGANLRPAHQYLNTIKTLVGSGVIHGYLA
ncbi:unknown protein [Seminavis robusta]|uniref:U-box domain-containing protein n=1 Tax=Seminavis robusta TaxID=568900 RepID=A0A9N8HZA8_9STRA|nr:unknown protein [Seminavis robusta]|eukprot:Sro3429_g347930.1 n/a (303) ;mRNA; f:2662-3570